MKVTIEYQKSIGGALRGLELYDQHDNRFTKIFPGSLKILKRLQNCPASTARWTGQRLKSLN